MQDIFPYDMASRNALVKLARDDLKINFKPETVTFEDMFFSPTTIEPGRTFIEMIDITTDIKYMLTYRRVDFSDPRAIGEGSILKIVGTLTPKAIAEEINRSRGWKLGPDDVSFDTTPINATTDVVPYTIVAMSSSYAYYGECNILIQRIDDTSDTIRLLENGAARYLENGQIRYLES